MTDIKHGVRKLTLTIKTHEAAGEIVARNIHSGGRWFLAGLGFFIKLQCQRLMAGFTHLIANSSDLVVKLKEVRLPPGDNIMAKIDLKDYFMTGTPAELATIASKPLEGDLRKLMYDVVFHCCSNQYIQCEWLEGAWKVEEGTGMGINYSGELSDWVFYCLAERRWTLKTGMRTTFGLHYWARFKDDAIAIMTKNERFLDFFGGLRNTAAPYRIKIETVSRSEIHMLECTLRLHNGLVSSSITVDFYTKPTAMKIPLSSTSGHVPSIHFSWPVSEIQRRRRLSSDEHSFLRNRTEFINSLRASHAPIDFLDYLKNVDGHQRTQIRISRPERKLWCVLPYHPAWHRAGLASIVDKFCKDPYHRKLYADATKYGALPTIAISWRSATNGLYKELVRLTH